MAVTIKDIARKANVTPTTVSLSLRDQPGVSAEKRKEIKRLAEQMGYRPNVLGRGLQGGKTHSVGILWSLCGPHNSMEVTRDLALRAQRHEYISYVVDNLSDPIIIRRALDEFARRGVDALIIQYDYPEEILDQLRSFQAVVVVGYFPKRIPVDSIYYNLSPGVCQMAKHFLTRGRRRPFVLSHIHDSESNVYKIESFLGEFRKQGIHPGPEAFLKSPSIHPQDVAGALEKRFPGNSFDFDTLFTMTDHLAAAAMKWLKQRGIRIPEEVAVGGFNDDDLCDYFDPPLASVFRNHTLLADEIERLIFTRLETPDLPPRNVEVPMTFVRRESAG